MPPLEGSARGDVLVVGAGFTGLSTALHLAERGVAAIVVDAETIGFGASGRNGGQVNPGLKPDPDEVERHFGAERGRALNAWAGGAPAFVFSLIERLGIRCEARRNGTLRAAAQTAHVAAVERTASQWAARGAPVEFLARDAVAAATGCERYRGAMLDRRGGDLNPLSYARGLANAAIGAGARIHGGTRIESLERVNGGWRARAAGAEVVASRVVIATNGYSDALWPGLRRSVIPVFSQIVATAPLAAALAARILPGRPVLYESGLVTVYYRLDAGGRLLIGGRGPLREINAPSDLPHLTGYARRLWPALGDTAWTHAWGGRIAMTFDHYPHIHEPADGILIALGYNGRGVALASALGAELARRVIDPRAPIAIPPSPLRAIPLHALWPLAVKAAVLRGRIADRFGR